MKNKSGVYTEAQKRATAKYMSTKHPIRVVVSKERAEAYKKKAQAEGKSLNQFIIDCIEEKMA